MSSSSSTKVCFNSNCKDVTERSRKGWRRRTGEFADLCDRCASAFEEGKFCETFHLNASGWRCCESCGKQVHCGCIVSFHMFVLLDAGGIECISCARKSFILTPNPAWPPPSLSLPVLPERIKDLSSKNRSQLAGSGPVPWRQAPSLFSYSSAQSDLQPRMPFEVHGGFDRISSSERLSASSLEIKKVADSSERVLSGSLKLDASEILENGSTGIDFGKRANPCVNVPWKLSFLKSSPSTSHFNLAASSAPPHEANEQIKAAQPAPPPLTVKQVCGLNGADSSDETQLANGRNRGDARARNQLLPRYWPRITDQELQQISGDSNSVITPLFEKMLSASDAGKIGRLVLPKKCAEAYFPPISQPEGLPLKVQDFKGKEWFFQFRFWPNNNSRMYVLEGVTPCIQSMQLQAGDIVTFSRIEPEGKLVMGFRKASTAPPANQGDESVNPAGGISTNEGGSAKKSKQGEVLSTPHQVKAKEVLGAKSFSRTKRKKSTLGTDSKRLKVENENLIELKLTWEQAQGVLRAPSNCVPTVVVIEGIEFEEYEDAPTIGRPTICAVDPMGENIQWIQCEDCLKWRKVPVDARLSSRWTCTENSWDPERSFCSVAQELTVEQLKDLLPTGNQADKKDPDTVDLLEGLDALANLAIQEEGEALPASSQATTKHPRHRPGCSCIVCIQPPSGKGPKHKQTCTCNVCLTVKRRFRTLMLRREKKQSEREAETAHQNLELDPNLPEISLDTQLCTNNAGSSKPHSKMISSEDPDDDLSRMRSSFSLFKGRIDLNIQPEKDEELSPISDSGGMMRLLQDATERYLRQEIESSSNNTVSSGNQAQPAQIPIEGSLGNGIAFCNNHDDAVAELPVPLSANALASASVTEK